jgi:CRP/FNR family transcriptional regulator, cyclic AMP receptor protein
MSRTAISSDGDVLSASRHAHAVETIRAQPPDSKLAAISRLPLFAGIPDEKLADLASLTHWQIHSAGETVVDIGDSTNEVFLIVAGAVRVVFRTAFGYESILNDLGPGHFFGELTAIDNGRRSANVTALLHTRLCVRSGQR